MNGAQLHLAINHFPIVLVLLSLAYIVWSFAAKNVETRRHALVILVLAALASLAALLSGDPAEDVIKNLPGISREVIHEHEEAGELAFWITAVTGACAAGLLAAPRLKWRLPAAGTYVVFALTLVSAAALARASHLGGLVRHHELSQDQARSER